jgi:c(7)-type cytochrome triheme protein
MRYLTLAAICFGFAVCGAVAAEKAPDKLVFEAKMGKVTFNHASHAAGQKGNCAACHTKLFPQDAAAPLNFKPKLHATAEAEKTSCGACHNPNGPAFAVKGNCAKCHVK